MFIFSKSIVYLVVIYTCKTLTRNVVYSIQNVELLNIISKLVLISFRFRKGKVLCCR